MTVNKNISSGGLRIAPESNGSGSGVVLGAGTGTRCLPVELPGSTVPLRERGCLLPGIPLTPQCHLPHTWGLLLG